MSQVIIIGSGVAGTLLARELLSGSEHSVTMFEAGPDLAIDYRTWLDHLMADVNPYEQFWEGPRREHQRFGLRGSRLFVKGGTTNHWGGWSLRFKPEDFELYARTGLGADWPINYEELAPYYARAETLLGIEGDSDDDDPPRFGTRFPFEAAPFTLNDTPVIEAFERLEMAYSHMPMARNGARCITTGTCGVCPVNARYTASFDLVQLLREHADRLQVRTCSSVSSVLMDGKTHCRGVRYADLSTGHQGSMEADLVAVCSGTVESTKLLLASADEHWPDGVGNESGHVGRHLVGHPLIEAVGIHEGNPDKAAQELGFITLACRHFDAPPYQAEGKMLFARVGDNNDALTFLEHQILDNVQRAEIEARLAAGLELVLEASVEQFESPENRIRLAPGTGRFGIRGTEIDFGVNEITSRALETHRRHLIEVLRAAGCRTATIRTEFLKPDGAHATSTCRMSRAAADGVVDANLRVHGTDNLYVCSNAVYPNVTAVNPTLTLAALAVRLAGQLSATRTRSRRP